MEHTPGPWTRRSIPGHLFEITGQDGEPVFRIRGGMMPTLADAYLIAAAPELRAALEMLTTAANQKDPDPLVMFATVEKARAALDKAKGRS